MAEPINMANFGVPVIRGLDPMPEHAVRNSVAAHVDRSPENQHPHVAAIIAFEVELADTVLAFEPMITAVFRNSDLSTEGKQKKLAEVGKKAIDRVRNHKGRESVMQHVLPAKEAASERVDHPPVPTEPADVALLSDTRRHVASLSPNDRTQFLFANITDPAIYAALAHSPAWMLKLTDAQRETMLQAARQLRDPTAAAEFDSATQTEAEIDRMIERAEHVIAKATGLTRDANGEWN